MATGVQSGGGAVYPAIASELAQWAVVVTLAAGVGLLVARRALRPSSASGATRGAGRDLPRALLAFGAAYASVVALAALLLALDGAESGFGLGRVALHLGAVCIAVACAVAFARSPRGEGSSVEACAGGVYVAALVAAVAI